MIWTTVFRMAAAVLVISVAALTGCRKSPAPPKSSAVPVIAADVLAQDTTNFVEYIGQTRAALDVEIRARVAGFLDTISFAEGTVVKSNTLLYTIDPRPFEATLAQAQGQLAQAEAIWLKAQQDTNRLGPLWQRHAISRQQFDDALAAERSAAAAVKAARAAVNASELQLDYTRIHAPFEGLVGKTEVKPGNLVGQGGATLLTTVSTLDPIHVRFNVSEKVFLEWRRHYDPDQAATNAVFELILADGRVHPQRGVVVFADRQVDPATGTLLLEVAFPNPRPWVRPGQFARVRFPIEVFPGALLVPQRSVQELQGTYSVFIEAGGQAQFRRVVLGPRVGSFYIVRDGLKPGEKVVIDGIQKLQNGVPLAVTLTNLAAEIAPRRVASL